MTPDNYAAEHELIGLTLWTAILRTPEGYCCPWKAQIWCLHMAVGIQV